jgi:phage terminase small subunit
MDIQAEINWIHQEIDKVKDPTFIEKMKHLLQSINTTSETTVTEYNIDIENALENIKKGNFHTEEEAKAISKKWGRK